MESVIDWVTAVGAVVAGITGTWMAAVQHMQARAQAARPEPIVESYQSVGQDIWDGWTMLGLGIRHYGPAPIEIEGIHASGPNGIHILNFDEMAVPDTFGGLRLPPVPPQSGRNEVRFARCRVLAMEPDRAQIGRVEVVVNRRPLGGSAVEMALIWHWTDQPRRSRRTSIQI